MDELSVTFDKFGSKIAGVIVEPIPGNMGVVLPDPKFLKRLREITREHGSLLIFDEVISGFRVGPGGAQQLYDVMPDLTCLGKIIGGGLPVGAYGGKREIMQSMAPEGDIYQAGTLSGNPLAMAAGLATLRLLQNGRIYKTLEERSAQLFSGLAAAAKEAGLPVVINRVGSMGSLFFTNEPVTDFASAKASRADLFQQFYGQMLSLGIYLAPSPFEAWFVSVAHNSENIENTISCAARSFSALQGKSY